MSDVLRGFASALAVALVLVVGSPAAAYLAPRDTELVAITSDGVQGNGAAFNPVMSADSRWIVFQSFASNLVPGDTNNTVDVFVREVETGALEMMSVSSDGAQGDGGSSSPSISGDGRYITFFSHAKNLVPGDANGSPDVFVHDHATGETELVSLSSEGVHGNNRSLSPAITPDGRFVAFDSVASNLVSGDTNGASDVFVRDRHTGTTERVSLDAAGAQAEDASSSSTISADGRYVAFASFAPLTPDDDNGTMDVYLRDRSEDIVERISPTTGGFPNPSSSFEAAISADGRFVAFSSVDTDLVPTDTNADADVFVVDRVSGEIERVSVTSAGEELAEGARTPSITPDGRFVSWEAERLTGLAEDEEWVANAYVHDRLTRSTEIVSTALDGGPPNDGAHATSVSADGGAVLFDSAATNLVTDDTNEDYDAFLRRRGAPLGIGRLTTARNGESISFSGWAQVTGSHLAQVADQSGDAIEGAESLGADLTGVEVVYRAELEDLLVAMEVTSFPTTARGAGGGLPAVLHVLRLTVNGTTYEVRASRVGLTAAPPAAPFFGVYRCEPVCLETARVAGSYGTTGTEVLVAVPSDALGLSEEAALTSLEAVTGFGEAGLGIVQVLDDAVLPDATIPAATVEFGAAPAGIPAEEMNFDHAVPLEEGVFAGTLDTQELAPGAHRLWARVALGDRQGPPAFAAIDSAGVSPQPTTTEPPPLELTTVTFTEDSATSGQHTDETFFEARLDASGTNPVAGEELTFDLTGAESSRDLTAATDEDGIASVTPSLTEKPGPYQLTVRYDGDDRRAPSVATVSFVVDREDTDTELTVDGRGQDMALEARLADGDSPWDGIAERIIDFYADGESIGSAETDSHGVATVEVPPGHRGANRTYEAVFEGDDLYTASADHRAGKRGAPDDGSETTAGAAFII